MQQHLDHDPPERFPTDPTGLPEAGRPELLELAPGDTLNLHIGPVAKRLGEATVRMLGYNGSIPGPTLKVRQGSEIIVHVTNQGDLDTTVHWHGLRLENQYDGVPHETQAPIPVGGDFTYRIQFPDAGLYWYHPTSARTTPRSWACTATSWSSPATRATGRRSTASCS
jgi:FtsP/CotA-like multicopper oxidase with cupredoxin domain